MLSGKYACFGLLGLLLTGCAAPPTSQRAGQAAVTARPPGAAAVYRIDAAHSELRVLAYRSGPLARLGHNHVIVDRALLGWVAVARPLASSSFLIEIPAVAFAVDDDEARRLAGSDFSAAVSDEAKAGTRRHMLGNDLLQAERHPSIIVSGSGLAGNPPAVRVSVTVRVAGHESRFVLPCVLDLGEGRLSASADLRLRQTALGITPYSLLLGALTVQDELRLTLKIVAVAEEPGPRGGFTAAMR